MLAPATADPQKGRWGFPSSKASPNAERIAPSRPSAETTEGFLGEMGLRAASDAGFGFRGLADGICEMSSPSPAGMRGSLLLVGPVLRSHRVASSAQLPPVPPSGRFHARRADFLR